MRCALVVGPFVLLFSHLFLIAVLLLVPWVVGRRLIRKWGLPGALFGAGLLAFIGAELLRLGASSLTRKAFLAQVLPLPSVESAPLLDAVIAGLAVTLATIGSLVLLYRYQIPEQRSTRDAIVVGFGFGSGALGLTGLLELLMAVAALGLKDARIDDVRDLGFAPRAALKVGLRIFEWWERSPLDALLHTGEWLLYLGVVVATSVLVAQKKWRSLGAAFVLFFGLSFAASFRPGYAWLGYGAGFGLLLAACALASKYWAKPESKAL